MNMSENQSNSEANTANEIYLPPIPERGWIQPLHTFAGQVVGTNYNNERPTLEDYLRPKGESPHVYGEVAAIQMDWEGYVGAVIRDPDTNEESVIPLGLRSDLEPPKLVGNSLSNDGVSLAKHSNVLDQHRRGLEIARKNGIETPNKGIPPIRDA